MLYRKKIKTEKNFGSLKHPLNKTKMVVCIENKTGSNCFAHFSAMSPTQFVLRGRPCSCAAAEGLKRLVLVNLLQKRL